MLHMSLWLNHAVSARLTWAEMPGRFPDPALHMDEYLVRADAIIV
jgi:hypothetical protein